MATLKDKFSKGLTTINVKTNNFMELNKINTYMSTIENEIADLKKQLGEQMYLKWMQDELDLAQFESYSNSIKEKYREIEMQKEKIEQLQKEEQQILGTNPGNQGQETIFCSNCRTANAANYKFCVKCGSPL